VGMETNPMMYPVGRDDTPPTQEQERQTYHSWAGGLVENIEWI